MLSTTDEVFSLSGAGDMLNKQQKNVCVAVRERNMLGNALKKTKAKYKHVAGWCRKYYFLVYPSLENMVSRHPTE